MKDLRKNILSRIYITYLFVVVFAIVVVAQLINVQYVHGSELIKKSKQLTLQYKNIPAVRGNIYSTNYNLLATSIPIYELRFDAAADAITDEIFNNNIDSIALGLAEIFKDKPASQYKSELQRARRKKSRYHLIKRNVKFTQLKKVKELPLFRKGRYKSGLIIEQQNKRVKPFNILAARTIGNKRENVMPVGIEGAYDKQLSGIDGKRLMQKMAGGIWVPVNDKNEIEPIDGSDVVSTIDVNLQDVAENALMKQLQMHESDHGCVILMEVKTGDVKAIANLQRQKNGSYYESYNYAIGESTEPGSTFKLPALMAALEDGYVDLDDIVDTKGGKVKYYDRTMYDSHVGGYGKITVKHAFEVSSNVGLSTIISNAYAKNPQQFVDRLNKMNLGQPLGIELSGEGRPLIKSPSDKSWSGTTLPWMSIGYEVRLTPLQILAFYNAVANNGKMVRPRFAKAISNNGTVVQELPTVVLNPSIASKETIRKAKLMLEGVVENGTAKNLKNSVFKIAGKTGTAQIANDKYGYKYKSKVSYQASFVGYFPADNPMYSCIVVVNAPSKNVYYGNLVAGPIFKEVADKVYAYAFSLHPKVKEKKNPELPLSAEGYSDDLVTVYKSLNIPVQDKSNNYDWVNTLKQQNNIVLQKHLIAPIYVPDVRGMSAKDALYLLENKGIDVELKGVGYVKQQSVVPGTLVSNTDKIILELGM
jgi:cell division protein FtsI (penicillin-binding protein 3)